MGGISVPLAPHDPSQLDVQNRAWAGARVYQSGNGSYSGQVHHTGATNIVYDTHGFYYSGGTLKCPFTGIYRITGMLTCNNSGSTYVHATELWLGAPGSALITRVAFNATRHENGEYAGCLAQNTWLWNQGEMVRLFGNHGVFETDLGGSDLLYLEAEYLGPSRQSKVG